MLYFIFCTSVRTGFSFLHKRIRYNSEVTFEAAHLLVCQPGNLEQVYLYIWHKRLEHSWHFSPCSQYNLQFLASRH